MKAQIVQIGNSQGVRIPKVLLEESGISGHVDLELCKEGILIRSVTKPRADWDEIFRSLQDVDNDVALDADVEAEFDARKWQW